VHISWETLYYLRNIKVFSVAVEMQQWISLHCFRVTKHLVLLTNVINIKHYECDYILALVNRHANHIHSTPWSVWLYYIFPHYLINGASFGNKVV
jgi:hypothetical protein